MSFDINLRSVVDLKLVFLLSLAINLVVIECQFNWQTRDSFDQIRKQLDSVVADNCKVVDINQLFLPQSSVTHIPDLKWLGIDPIFPNRTNLLHIHNMALSRAFYLRSVPPAVRQWPPHHIPHSCPICKPNADPTLSTFH